MFSEESQRDLTEKMCFNESREEIIEIIIKKCCQCTFWQVIIISHEWMGRKKAR